MAEAGKVYLVGAGPGAPDLLTLRAARLLGRGRYRAARCARPSGGPGALPSNAELIPVGKRCGAHSTAQRFINKRLVDAAREHRVVIRLKGGDPMLFGRAQEEIDALQAAGIPFEVVPGVTAALAASAQLGISLTRRGVARTITFVTPRIGEDETATNWAAAVVAADTAAIYMGAGQAEAIAPGADRAGLVRRDAGRRRARRIAARIGNTYRNTERAFGAVRDRRRHRAGTRCDPAGRDVARRDRLR
jgi:uroporphyrin-III C-methyltransferase